MRIVGIIQRYPPAVGGSETWCQEVFRRLATAGHNVSILTMNINKEEEFWREPLDEDRKTAFGRMALDQGISVRRYKRSLPIHSVYHGILRLFLDKLLKIYFYGPHSAEMYGKMWREIKRADIVFLNTVPYPHNFIAYAFARLMKKKTIIVPHFHPGHPYHERRTHYSLLKNCDGLITVTPFEKEFFESKSMCSEKIFVTGNGINPDLYLPVDLDSFRENTIKKFKIKNNDNLVIYLGRKMPEKGIAFLIDAVKSLASEMAVKLFLAGPSFEWFNELYGGLTESEKECIIDMGLLSHSDKVNMLHMADLLVLPSKFEAFGIVFLEAWICGTPVLGTYEGAMPGVVGDEGFLCKYGDTDDLRSVLSLALSDMDTLKEKGARGREKVLTHYTWDKIGQKAEEAVNRTAGRKKIIFCCNSYPPYFIGGAELIAHTQAKTLKKLGYEVTIFAGEINNNRERYSLRHDTFEELSVTRLCLHDRDFSAGNFNFTHKEVESRFNDLLDEFSPDIVHFHNIVALSVGLIQTAAKRNIPTLLTLHDYWGICHKNTLMKNESDICEEECPCTECQPFISGERWGGVPSIMRRDFIACQFDLLDNLVSPSKYLAKRYVKEGIGEGKMNVIPYGIDVERFSKIKKSCGDGRIRFSFIGYIGRHKGVFTILDALSYIDNREEIVINFFGDGEQKEELMRLVQTKGFDDFVRFPGKVDNSRIEEVYCDTDIMLLPSVWPDNHPVSIYEAMASSIPVVASRMGGIPELVEEGKTGYLFDAGNAMALAEKMSMFIRDRSRIKEFGERGFEKISKYTIVNLVKEVSNLYRVDHMTGNKPSLDKTLILCCGGNVSSDGASAMELFSRQSDMDCRFIMADWLDDKYVEDANVLWVSDDDLRPEDLMKWLSFGLPLLVPGKNDALRRLCIDGNCGLYYGDPIEASLCLEYLIQNESIAYQMGRNSFRYFYKVAQGQATV